MSYRCGNITRKLARDFKGVAVTFLRDHETKGGTRFAEGDAAVIMKAWRGRLILERKGDGKRISGVSGYDVCETRGATDGTKGDVP